MKNLQSVFTAFLFLLIGLISCKQDKTITIKGDIKGLNEKWVYLQFNYPLDIPPIDSARITGGRFEFRFRPDTSFQAEFVSLRYVDKKGKNNFIGVANPYCEDKKNPLVYISFMMEPGVTILEGDLSKGHGVTIKSGFQNEVYFKNPNLPVISISKDSVRRNIQIQRIKKFVEDNPEAYWAFFTLNGIKNDLSKQQLRSIYAELSDEIKSSTQGKNLKQYIEYKPDEGQFPNSVFVDKDAKTVNLVDTTKKLNMVVFWASWCGPCRREIPALKKIAALFNGHGVRLVSVSKDDDKSAWLNAVAQENMPWEQLILQPAVYNKAIAMYDLGYIPKIYLVNNKNKVVKKIDGFSEANEEVVKTFITDYLAKN
ncbi:MAG TPA: TlpA disulfide reductase family protein [Mucilaginibacter sp.]|nr:TlpA disulfide reductase family protein [Mucilaginibacter sp.]